MKEYSVNKVKNEWMKKGMVGWGKEYMKGYVKEGMNEIMNEVLEEYRNEWMEGGRRVLMKWLKKEELKKDGFVELELMKGLGWMWGLELTRDLGYGVRINVRVRVNKKG